MFLATLRLITGTSGDDIMIAKGGADLHLFYSSSGADKITGIKNVTSRVDYQDSNAAVKVYLDGKPGEGGHAEGDVLNDINSVTGTDFADYIVGSDEYSEVSFTGNAGLDEIVYSSSNAGVTVDLGLSTASGGHADGDVLISIENIWDLNLTIN